MEVSFVPVTAPAEIERCAALAAEIWREHYIAIISEEQIDYMVRQFQSAHAISRQIEEEGYRYFLMERDGAPAGYFAWRPDEEGAFLSKIYVRRDARGHGLARAAVRGIEEAVGHGRIWLTVNRGNSGSIAAYRKLGFEVAREQCADIGGGFVMDDYIMEKNI